MNRIILGIVTEKLDNGNLQFAEGINYPRFFQESTYTDENEETYFANKEIKDYKLGFKKEGDTYYLTSVKKPAGKTDLQNLDKIRYSQWSKWGSAALFSNEFWPLDDVKPYRGMDHYEGQGSDDGKIHNWHFGMVFEFDFTVDDYKGPMNFYFRGDDDFWMFIDGIKAIDIGGIHSAGGEAIDINEFFAKQKIKAEGTHHVKIYFMERGGTGSCCYLQFTLPNCKPVSFPGVDTANLEVEKHWDDFNDPLRPEKITIQLYRKEIDEAGNPVIKDEDKKLNANGKPIIENGMPVIKDEVKDKYDDDWFRLIDEDDKIKPEQELGGYENIWKCRWEELPKVNPNSKNKYIYKVKEKNVDGYKSTYSYVITPSKDLNVDSNSDNTQNDVKIEGDAAQDYEIKFGEGKDEINGNITCIITNTLSPKVTVEVEKKWRDDNQLSTIQNRPSVTLQLQYKKEGENEFINFPGDKGVLTLDGTVDVNIDSETGKKIKSAWEDGAWHGRFEDLPTFANKDENGKSTRVPIVAYRVREYKQGTNDELLENDYSAFSSEYTVTYNDTEPTKIEQANPSNDPGDVVAKTEITNAVATNCSVRKEWKDVPSTVNATAKIGLCWRISGTDDWKLVNHYMKEETNTSDKSKSIIWLAQGREEDKKKFFFTFESNSEIQIGKWKNLPKYNESGQEIQYKIFELDGSDSLITIPENGEVIVTIDNQKYKVTSTTEDAGNDTPGFDDESDSGSSNSEDDIPETNGESTSSSGIQDVVVITNQYMAQLQVTKRIDVKEEELVKYSDKEFKFVVKIKNKENNQVIKLPDPGNSEKYTVEESGDVTFTLTPTETITIPVPIGSIVTITEDTKGYSVQYTGVDGGSSNGNTATITITTNSSKTIEVTCTNKPGVVLPDTGGPGLLMMSRLGWMLLLLALLMAGMEIQFYGERRNRKTANVQREDTRGFDPDDY